MAHCNALKESANNTALNLCANAWAHVTLQVSQPLRPKGFATVALNVPNERHVDNTKVTLEVPEAFLKAGGRLNRVLYPAGWTVTVEKKDKPSEIYNKEKDDRSKRDAKKESGPDHGAKAAKSDADAQEKRAMDEMRKKWITKVTFAGGTIPPDGFQQFEISFQLPEEPGNFRFAAVQTYADGKEVSWSELVEGAEHPAASLNISKPPLVSYGDLALAMAALALLASLAGLFKRSRTQNETARKSAVVMARN
jgi:hypothetical protein